MLTLQYSPRHPAHDDMPLIGLRLSAAASAAVYDVLALAAAESEAWL
jgi:hypothetical protein